MSDVSTTAMSVYGPMAPPPLEEGGTPLASLLSDPRDSDPLLLQVEDILSKIYDALYADDIEASLRERSHDQDDAPSHDRALLEERLTDLNDLLRRSRTLTSRLDPQPDEVVRNAADRAAAKADLEAATTSLARTIAQLHESAFPAG